MAAAFPAPLNHDAQHLGGVGFRDLALLRRRPKGHIEAVPQQSRPDYTPIPVTDDWGTLGNPRTDPRNTHVMPTAFETEHLYLRCDEWADTVHKLVGEVWRRGIEVAPVHDLVCDTCGEAVNDSDKACVFCGDQASFRPPDEEGRLILEDFMHAANREERRSLGEEGMRKTEEMLKHGTGFIVIRYEYTRRPDGTILTARPVSVKAASGGRMRRLRKENDTPGGWYVCIECRPKPGYQAQRVHGPCHQCKSRVTYEAWYGETDHVESELPVKFYLPNEVEETSWPYQDGSPPVVRLRNKIWFLVNSDMYAAAAVDPDKPYRPDVMLITMGGDADKMYAWAKRDAEEAAKNPTKLRHLHLPSPPGGFGDLKMGAEVANLGDIHIRGNIPDIRDNCVRRIRAHYGIAPVKGGDTEAGGGLNNEGLQLRSESAVAQDIQTRESTWLKRLAQRLGVIEWTYRFKPPLEEDDSRAAEAEQKNLDVAQRASALGLKVRWVKGKARISDGEVVGQDDRQFAPLGAPSPVPGSAGGLRPIGIDTPKVTNGRSPPGPAPSGNAKAPSPLQTPVPGAPPAATTADQDVQDLGLNGAQVSDILDVISKLQERTLTRDAAIAIIHGAFPFLNPSVVNAMVPASMPPPEPAQEPKPPMLVQTLRVLRQAWAGPYSDDGDLPAGVANLLGGPSGAVEAGDEAFTHYAGLTPDLAQRVKKDIVDALTNVQGWSTNSIAEAIKAHWQAAGFDPDTALARARTAARTEVRSIASEFKRRNYHEEEDRRQERFRYRVRGADDFRTTKLSRWVRGQVPPEGLELAALEQLLDQAVALAVQGAFDKTGTYASTPGNPIKLPAGFQRRGFLIHFNDRDTVVRVPR